jgi:hypothetical protein
MTVEGMAIVCLNFECQAWMDWMRVRSSRRTFVSRTSSAEGATRMVAMARTSHCRMQRNYKVQAKNPLRSASG